MTSYQKSEIPYVMFKILSTMTPIHKQSRQVQILVSKYKAYKTVLLGDWDKIIQNYNAICSIGDVTQNDEIGLYGWKFYEYSLYWEY